jgi:undecaprenyl-diphosphatase
METPHLNKRNQRATLLMLLISLIGFSLTALLRPDFSVINANVNSWSDSIHSSLFTQVAIDIDFGLDTIPMMVFSAAVAAYLLHERRTGYALLLVGAMLSGAALLLLFRALIFSPRPSDSLIVVQGYSFPSGHVTSSVVFFGLLTYMAWGHWGSFAGKSLSGSSYAATALVVGFDRIYLNVHWFSDVLGGYFLGILLVTISIMISGKMASHSARHRVQTMTGDLKS